MYKRIHLLLIMLAVCCSMVAGIPEGYYTAINGSNGLSLKTCLNTSISSHKTLGYNSLWEHYPHCYYHLDAKSRVYDMYSNEIRFYTGNGAAVTKMNKEHTVPKSWWGGSTSAQPGNDLYNVIPSDADANSRKSNYALGIAKQDIWTNGVTTVGKGTVNGHSATFFEPCDEYKGDFARIYFYMAVCYPNIWQESADAMTSNNAKTLKDWIIPMLLQWHTQDPVCETEIQRNEDIYAIQENRNPFIDYPELAEYIWGSHSTDPFILSEHTPNSGGETNFTANAPKFDLTGGTEEQPKEVVKGTALEVRSLSTQAVLHIRINNGAWETVEATTKYFGGNEIKEPAAKEITINEDTKVEAYCTQEGYNQSATIAYYYKVVDFSNDYLLYEAFDAVTGGNNTATSGSSSAWNGNENFPTVVSAFNAGGAIKIGSGSKAGSITSRTLTTNGGTINVSLSVKGWTNVEGALNITLGNETKKVEYTATMGDDFETINLIFNDVKSNPTLTIATTAKRAFIDDIRVQQQGATKINTPVTNEGNRSVYYNLAGQRIGNNYRGIIIQSGRKILR